jgi:hypothetical protein
MSLEFLSREATDKLAREVASNLDAYRTGQSQTLIRASDCRVSRIDAVGPPDLVDTAGDHKPDAEASQLIFQWLSHLTPVQASDERLWILLTHHVFSRYVHARWGGSLEGSTRPEDRVLDRWFFRGTGVATFVRNGISRLWWFGYLTYDSKRPNPFELTDILLSLQDIQVAFLERSLGRCKPLLRTVLETVKKNETELRQTPNTGDLIQEWAKEIRLYGGAFLLDAVPPDRLAFVLNRMLRTRIAATPP